MVDGCETAFWGNGWQVGGSEDAYIIDSPPLFILNLVE
jgi:hypothetical protein